MLLPLSIRSLLSGKTIYCSFSGGADSLALLLMLHECAGDFCFKLKAIHFEHGFRGEESREDARFCKNICQNLSIPCDIFTLDVPNHKFAGEGDEAAARRMRLESWKNIITDPEYSLVALGHHADDRTENVLLRLFRGANASGLSSMRVVQKINGITFIRPLLEMTHQELMDFLIRKKITWRHDSTNDSVQYGRNFIRLELIPYIEKKFPFAHSGIRQSVRTLEEDACCLEQLAQQIFDSLPSATLPQEILAQQPRAIRVRLLRLFLQRILERPEFIPDAGLLERLNELLEHPRTAQIPLPGIADRMLVLYHGELTVEPKQKIFHEPSKIWDPVQNSDCDPFHAELLSPDEAKFTGDNYESFFDADQLSLPLHITYWEAGDRIIPFGRQHPVLLKKLFADAGINTAERSRYPVIRDAHGTILWVAGLRTGNHAVITPQTHRVLRLFMLHE